MNCDGEPEIEGADGYGRYDQEPRDPVPCHGVDVRLSNVGSIEDRRTAQVGRALRGRLQGQFIVDTTYGVRYRSMLERNSTCFFVTRPVAGCKVVVQRI